MLSRSPFRPLEVLENHQAGNVCSFVAWPWYYIHEFLTVYQSLEQAGLYCELYDKMIPWIANHTTQHQAPRVLRPLCDRIGERSPISVWITRRSSAYGTTSLRGR